MATKSELIELLTGYGWVSRPAYPHIYYNERVPYRYKFTTFGLRRESRTPSGEWVRLRSGYYKNLRIEEGKVYGMKRQGM